MTRNTPSGDDISNWAMRVVGLFLLIYFALTNKDISTGWLGAFGILFGVASIVTLRNRDTDDDENDHPHRRHDDWFQEDHSHHREHGNLENYDDKHNPHRREHD